MRLTNTLRTFHVCGEPRKKLTIFFQSSTRYGDNLIETLPGGGWKYVRSELVKDTQKVVHLRRDRC